MAGIRNREANQHRFVVGDGWSGVVWGFTPPCCQRVRFLTGTQPSGHPRNLGRNQTEHLATLYDIYCLMLLNEDLNLTLDPAVRAEP